MTKAQQILDLYPEMFAKHGPKACRLIGEIVGCRPQYVRVVARQRKGGGASEIDRRYCASPLGKHMTRLRYPKRNAMLRALWRTGDYEAGRATYRKTYHEARFEGLSVREADRRASYARTRVQIKTGDRAAARAAYSATPAEPPNV